MATSYAFRLVPARRCAGAHPCTAWRRVRDLVLSLVTGHRLGLDVVNGRLLSPVKNAAWLLSMPVRCPHCGGRNIHALRAPAHDRERGILWFQCGDCRRLWSDDDSAPLPPPSPPQAA